MEISHEHNVLGKIAAGDGDAFERLFFQYQPRLVYFLTGLTHDKEVSRDMAQDIFLLLWRDRSKLKEVKSFSSYLFQMARFTVYDYFDHLSISEKYADELLQNPAIAESEEEALFVRELQSVINHAVSQMSPQRQRVFRMSREQGLSNDEIAQRLNLNKRTVENHLTASLAILRKVLYLMFVSTMF